MEPHTSSPSPCLKITARFPVTPKDTGTHTHTKQPTNQPTNQTNKQPAPTQIPSGAWRQRQTEPPAFAAPWRWPTQAMLGCPAEWLNERAGGTSWAFLQVQSNQVQTWS